MAGDLRPYEARVNVEEYFPTGAIEALPDGDFKIEFLCHGLTVCGKRYYTQEALRAAAESGVFDNAKMYMNHPRKAEQHERGHRDLRDWGATIREGSVTFRDGNLQAVCHAHTPEALAILNDPVAKKAVGLSQVAVVRTTSKVIEGQKRDQVEAIEQVFSVDFVPAGNTRGRVIEAAPTEEEPEMALEDLTLEALKEARPDLVALIEEAVKPQEPEVVQEQEPQEPEVSTVDEALRAELETLRTEKAQAAVMTVVTETIAAEEGLTEASRKRLVSLFRGRVVEAAALPAEIQEAVAAEKAYALELLKEAGVRTRVVGANSGAPEAKPEQVQESYEEQYAAWLRRSGATSQQISTLTKKES